MQERIPNLYYLNLKFGLFLGTILLLFMLFFIQNTNSSLPAVPYLKAVDIWFYCCLVFILISLLAVVFTTELSRKRKAACNNSLQVENLQIAANGDTVFAHYLNT